MKTINKNWEEIESGVLFGWILIIGVSIIFLFWGYEFKKANLITDLGTFISGLIPVFYMILILSCWNLFSIIKSNVRFSNN